MKFIKFRGVFTIQDAEDLSSVPVAEGPRKFSPWSITNVADSVTVPMFLRQEDAKYRGVLKNYLGTEASFLPTESPECQGHIKWAIENHKALARQNKELAKELETLVK